MNKNRKAFLDMIAISEGTRQYGDDGYDLIVIGADKKIELFTDHSQHPFAAGRKPKKINSKGLYSSAAGRYQFMRVHWKHYKDLLKLPDFWKESQDKWAIQLIKECRALDDIDAGRFDIAVHKCRRIWASLPGAEYGQHENKIEPLRTAYLEAGGKLA
jgi:muramidase (phage lysozyme)